MKNSKQTYGSIARILHGVNAILIILVWLSHDLDGGGQLFYATHILLGLVALGFTIAQLIWYFVDRSPDALPELSPLRKMAIHWNHILIMVTATFAGVSGVVLWQLDRIEGIHELMSNALVLLFLMHVAGVLFYQFTKGNTLGRMGLDFFKQSKPS